MKDLNLSSLVDTWKSKYNSNIISINDLIIKEMEGEHLSCNQFMAIQNFYKTKIKYLGESVNGALFTENSFVTRLAANFVPYKEFI